ncbi:MAG: type IV toxin-antitoxin system AbiEi family antitoxin [Deltaproteobacteria bacterium]|nr:type IV toxin-antitoxin system AbiEi family antitoxin [Deltaproteobacteria bacterium]
MNVKKNSKPMDMSAWIDSRQSQGLYFFSREEALKYLQISGSTFKKAAMRLAYKNRICRIRSGFFVIIPLEYSATGILPAEWFIDDLMGYTGQSYYVGLLSAAALHGAAHQQPQQFHVVTTGALREIKIHDLTIRFFSRASLDKVALNRVKVQTGHIPVSTPEATALDLIRYSRRIGGIDRVFTVLQELGETMDPKKLEDAVKTDGNVAYIQRLGFLLEKAGFSSLAEPLSMWVSRQKTFPIKLDISLPASGVKKDERWKVLVNLDIEGDL